MNVLSQNPTAEKKYHAIDWLYFVIAAFTYFFIAVTAFLFFTQLGERFYALTIILDSLVTPYLGSVGIYVILKEIRKRRLGTESKHWGQLFVVLWLALLFVSLPLIIFSDEYVFDWVANVIVATSLSVLVIYLGGAVHKP